MKAHLLYCDRDFDPARSFAGSDTVRDIDLATVFGAMSSGDAYTRDVVQRVVLNGMEDENSVLYRQAILRDCIEHADVVQDIYDIIVEAIEAEKRDFFGSIARSPSSVLFRSTSLLETFTDTLQALRQVADQQVSVVASEGFCKLLTMLKEELNDEYLQTVRQHLKELQFAKGVLLSAELTEGNKGTGYVLRSGGPASVGWIRSIFGASDGHSFQIADRDDIGARALEALRTRGLSDVARAVGQSVDHILSFFQILRYELAYYLGCVRLYRVLAEIGVATCFPSPAAVGSRVFEADGLRDVALALRQHQGVASNDIRADGVGLVIITGANQGGKSTFLRSCGVAQLMMQCGMFVAADRFSAELVKGLFTHFKREEDINYVSGKLDEELRRMSAIVDKLVPNSLVLFNESFSATNELEGSDIADQVVSALTDRGVKVLFVTHHYEFARRFIERASSNVLFLKAERLVDGTRTFRVIAEMPDDTSYGEDIYRQIFLGGRSDAHEQG